MAPVVDLASPLARVVEGADGLLEKSFAAVRGNRVVAA